MFREDIPRFANFNVLRLTSRFLTGYRYRLSLIKSPKNNYLCIICGPRGTEEYREGNIYLRYRFGTSFRLKRRNSEKDTQFTISYDIYPHKSLVYMLLRYNYHRNGHFYR